MFSMIQYGNINKGTALFVVLPPINTGLIMTHSCRLYSATPLGNQVASSMTRYPSQSHYPDTEPTSPCPMLRMLNNWLGSDKYQLYKPLV